VEERWNRDREREVRNGGTAQYDADRHTVVLENPK
jgi:hypothetical protein